MAWTEKRLKKFMKKHHGELYTKHENELSNAKTLYDEAIKDGLITYNSPVDNYPDDLKRAAILVSSTQQALTESFEGTARDIHSRGELDKEMVSLDDAPVKSAAAPQPEKGLEEASENYKAYPTQKTRKDFIEANLKDQGGIQGLLKADLNGWTPEMLGIKNSGEAALLERLKGERASKRESTEKTIEYADERGKPVNKITEKGAKKLELQKEELQSIR